VESALHLQNSSPSLVMLVYQVWSNSLLYTHHDTATRSIFCLFSHFHQHCSKLLWQNPLSFSNVVVPVYSCSYTKSEAILFRSQIRIPQVSTLVSQIGFPLPPSPLLHCIQTSSLEMLRLICAATEGWGESCLNFPRGVGIPQACNFRGLLELVCSIPGSVRGLVGRVSDIL